MQKWLEWFKERIVYVLLTVILLLSGTVAWLGFKPDADEMEWRTVNQQMERALQETDAGAKTDAGSQKDSGAKPGDESKEKTVKVVWPLDLNQATLDQLDELPGIGPSKAQAIIDLRTKLGGFRSPDQLLDVKGIGPKTYEKFRDKVTVGK